MSKQPMAVERVVDFFNYAAKRQAIKDARDAGVPFPYNNTDPILQNYRFCNVFREDDTVTTWFRENIRSKLEGDSKVFIATVAFRWFNRVTTGELIKDVLVDKGWDAAEVTQRLTGVSPVTTGAYMIKTPAKMSKLDGLVQCINNIAIDVQLEPEKVFNITENTTLEQVWEQLRKYPYMGNFMAYEVVTDLRHTHLLRNAPDTNSWASVGPGAARGIERILNVPVGSKYSYASQKDIPVLLEYMQELLELSRVYWSGDRLWEMREVEHTLCEFDKYERALTGEGKPKQIFRKGV
jgi:hypothetical protein